MSDPNPAGKREIMHRAMGALLAIPTWTSLDAKECAAFAAMAVGGGVTEDEAMSEILAMRRDRGMHVDASLPLKDRILKALSEHDPRALASITVDTVRGMIVQDRPIPGSEIIETMGEICRSPGSPVDEVWMLQPEGDDLPVELDDETLRHWREQGELVNPETGEVIDDPADLTWKEWRAKV